MKREFLIPNSQFSIPRRISAAGWRIVLLASLGGTLEFYDFVIFGIFAKDIADAIFPNPTPLVSLMVSFGAFAVGYFARPIGGIVLSHFGDRHGRLALKMPPPSALAVLFATSDRSIFSSAKLTRATPPPEVAPLLEIVEVTNCTSAASERTK